MKGRGVWRRVGGCKGDERGWGERGLEGKEESGSVGGGGWEILSQLSEFFLLVASPCPKGAATIALPAKRLLKRRRKEMVSARRKEKATIKGRVTKSALGESPWHMGLEGEGPIPCQSAWLSLLSESPHAQEWLQSVLTPPPQA